jgi:hypothetical protein
VHQNGVPLRAHQIHVSAQDGGIAQISCYDDSRLGSPKQINGLSQFHCITLRLNQAALLQFLWDSSVSDTDFTASGMTKMKTPNHCHPGRYTSPTAQAVAGECWSRDPEPILKRW